MHVLSVMHSDANCTIFSAALSTCDRHFCYIFFSEELQRRKHQRQKKLRMEKRREQKSAATGATSYSSADRSAASKYLLCMFS